MADVAAEDPPDFRRLDGATLEVRRTRTAIEDAASALVPEDVWQRLLTHARSRLDVEVGGVLLGGPRLDALGNRYLLVDGFVPALAAPSGGSSVTFTADAWIAIHASIDRDRPGAQIVGWYHTHPRFGVFLSPMDVFIQRHFFALHHQVAIVVDPAADESGAFLWYDGEPVRRSVLVESCRRSPRRPWAVLVSLRARWLWRAVGDGLRRRPRRR